MMAKTPKKPKPEDIETVPDAWERFEKAIYTVTRKSPKPKDPPPSQRTKTKK